MNKVNETIHGAQDEMIPQFAAAFDANVGKAIARWSDLKEVVSKGTSTISSAFKAAGQGELGGSFETAVQTAESKIDGFVKKLGEANDDLQKSATALQDKDAASNMLNRVTK